MIKKAVSVAQRLAFGSAPTDVPPSLDAIALTRLDGSPLEAAQTQGKVLLFVNVASKCGLTPQYEGLVALQEKYRDRGLVVIGTPCNQFLFQEPGSSDEIASFCSLTYGVDFPLLEKQAVNGGKRSDLYKWLIGSGVGGGGDINWNFEKFLVGREGAVVARFAPTTKPEAAEVVAAIEAALG